MAIDKIRPRFEFKPSGQGWQDWTEDVARAAGCEVTRGIHGDRPTDRVAEPGIAQFAMLNSASNSAATQGYYSPGNASVRSGFAVGMGCRISIVANADACVDSDCVSSDCVSVATVQAIHTGDVGNIDPEPGQNFATLTHVTSYDYMEQLSRAEMPACSVLQGVNESGAIQEILDGMTKRPFTAETVMQGPDTLNFWGDLTRDEDHYAITGIQEVAQSGHGTFYIKGNGGPVYEPRNEKRAVESSPLTSTIDLAESDLRAGRIPTIVDNTRDRVSLVKVTMTPRETDGTTEVLAQLTEAIAFPVGTTTITLPFTDPDERGLRAAAVSTISPVENTDYDFNSEEDGSGTDHSANVTVTPTFCGNSVDLAIDTTAAGVIVYPVTSGGATLLQVRGTVVVSKEPIFFEAEDTTIDQNSLTINLPYQSEPAVASALATWYKDTLADDERMVKSVPLRLDQSNVSRAIEIMQLEISDGVTVVETVTGLDGTEKFIINAIDYDINGDGSIWPTLHLAPWDTGPFIEFGADHLTTGGVTSTTDDITSATTSSVTPTAGRLVTIAIAAKRGSSTNPGAPTVSGLGATWTNETDVIYDGAGTTRRRQWLFSAVESSYTSGKITISNFGGTSQAQGRISWSVSQHETTGTTSATAIVQTATNSGAAASSLTVTLAAFANAANRPAAFFACSTDDIMGAESGYTLLGTRGKRTSVMTMQHESSADTTPTATIPSLASASGGIAIEIKKD